MNARIHVDAPDRPASTQPARRSAPGWFPGLSTVTPRVRRGAALGRFARGRAAGALLFAPALIGAPPAPAQEAPQAGFSVGAGVVGGSSRELDGGGEASVTSAGIGLSHRWAANPGAIEAGLRVDTEDWTFDDPAGFGAGAPWDRLYRIGVSAGWQRPVAERWRLGWRASLGLAAEEGADMERARSGAIGMTLLHVASPDFSWGLALSASREIGRQRVRVVPLIDWRFAERWRLGSLAPGAALGAAGLELSYRASSTWSAGIGIGASEHRYRLDDRGPGDGGIAQTRSRPVFARIGWTPQPGHRLELYGGVDSGGELRLEDRERRLVEETDLERGPFIGLGWSSRF